MRGIFIKRNVCLPLMALTLAGCTGAGTERIIKQGDPVRISYTCRPRNGELAATTDKNTATDTSTKKSPLYLPPREFGPVSLKAGVPPQGSPLVWGFTDEIAACLTPALPGMSVGGHKSLECAAELVPGRAGGERFLRMAKVRTRPKEMRISRDEYIARFGPVPDVGGRLALDPAFPGNVTEVTEKEVVITFPMPEKGEVPTPFGKGKVRDAGDHYKIDIDAKAGDLVRTGPLAGRISEVNERFITIDYGYRFAGETLQCEMKTEEAR